MKRSEKNVPKRVKAAMLLLQAAMEELDGISRDNRSNDVDKIINIASDNIYEAKEVLGKMELLQYGVERPSENIRIRKHNGMRYVKVTSANCG